MGTDTKTENNNHSGQAKREMSLEELDVECRKYNHLHDEEILHIIGRFFDKIAGLFKHESHHHGHPSVR